MKRYLSYLFFLITIAGNANPTWHQGAVILADRRVIVGNIAVEQGHDIVLFKVNDKVDVYPAFKIRMVYFYDPESNINRKYVSLTETKDLFPRYQLYEIVLEGEIRVMRKLKTGMKNTGHDDRLDYNYFVQMENDIFALRKFRSKVFPSLHRMAGQRVTQFIRERKLDINRDDAAIEIIEFFNKQTFLYVSR